MIYLHFKWGGYTKSEVDTLLNGKADSSHTHTKSQITDFPSYGTTANTICEGNDSRLSDARTPTSHTHSKSEITDFPTIPTVNNATLTIQKNGTTVNTFTANASSDVTCNITVPTKTSDLTNDSGFLTSHQDLSGYIPRSGGAVLNGQTYSRTVDNNTLNVYGGTGYGHGAFLQLTGKDDAGNGEFNIQANNGTTNTILKGKADGTLRWNNKNIAMQEDLATVATSGSYTDLSDKPTIPTVNNATLTIQQNSVTVDTFTANSSTDKTVNIQCVDLSSNQTIGGTKTFSNAPVVSSIKLDGKTIDTDANNNMTFNGNVVETIEEQGNGYIRYSNGLQICWVNATMTISVYNWSFPKTFLQNPVVTATIFYPGNNYNVWQRCVELNNLSSTGVLLRSANHQFGSNEYYVGTDNVNAIAVGYWK